MARLILHNISKSYHKKPVLRSIDLSVEEGELLVILGPSGCGKSTLLDIIAGLTPADSGEILLDGRRIDHLEPPQRHLAMVFQNYALYPHMTVYDNLSFGLRMRGYPKKEIRARVLETAAKLTIDHLLDRKPKQLSGGERQRVAMGRALVRRPRVYLLDEPLSNLDAQLRSRIRTEIKRMHAELKTTMIFVTHDQVEAMTLADRIVVMNAGEIIQIGSPDEIYHCPFNEFTATFLGNPGMNILDARDRHSGNLLEINGHLLSMPSDIHKFYEDLRVGFRPEHIILHNRLTGAHTGTHDGLTLRGTVAVIEPTGVDQLCTIDCGGLTVNARSTNVPVPVCSDVTLFVAAEHLHFFDFHTGRRLPPASDQETGIQNKPLRK